MAPAEPVALLAAALQQLAGGPAADRPPSLATTARLAEILAETADRLNASPPLGQPLYAGQMTDTPHAVAWAAYALAAARNNNNFDVDTSRATTELEAEAVREIAAMFGWSDALAHLCGGGTIGNLEALWVARQVSTGGVFIASQAAHFVHRRNCDLLCVPFETTPTDQRGRIDIALLEQRLREGGVACVIATVGSTAFGAVDQIDRIVELQHIYRFRLHIDAAYGGYFVLADSLAADTAAAYRAMGQADSIVIDPHKHGLQPYGCGCVLIRNAAVRRFYDTDNPYTGFSEDGFSLGEVTLEVSRPGAAAAALWATQRLFPLRPGGAFAGKLDRCHQAALRLHECIQTSPDLIALHQPELDIVVWALRGTGAREISGLTRRIFDRAADGGLHLALLQVPSATLATWIDGFVCDQPTTTCFRSCLLKNEHLDWVDEIWRRFDGALRQELGSGFVDGETLAADLCA